MKITGTTSHLGLMLGLTFVVLFVCVTEANTDNSNNNNNNHKRRLSAKSHHSSSRANPAGPLPPPLIVDTVRGGEGEVLLGDSNHGDSSDNVMDTAANEHVAMGKHTGHHRYRNAQVNMLHHSHHGNAGRKESTRKRQGDHGVAMEDRSKHRKHDAERKKWAHPKSDRETTTQKEDDADLCAEVKCKRKEVCVLNPRDRQPECVHRKALRERKWEEHGNKKPRDSKKTKDSKRDKQRKPRPSRTEHKKLQKARLRQGRKLHTMVKKMKNKAERFRDRYEEKKRHKLHHIRQVAHGEHSPEGATGRKDLWKINSNNVETENVERQHCSEKDLAAMSKRLLDWFKVIQDQEQGQHDHVIQKRNSMKKELHEKDECICQAPVRYEFLVLDKDEDDFLSGSELKRLDRSPDNQRCLETFVASCDLDLDGGLSSKEWCCCFADVLPPCLADMARVPAAMVGGKQSPAVMPGAMVPQCDDDGFYLPLQCHGSTGYCWCVDRSGVKVAGSVTRGAPDCEQIVRESSTTPRMTSHHEE